MNDENLRPCKPGETHNPNGRPKGKSFKSIIEKLMGLPAPQRFKNLLELQELIGDTSRLTNDEALAARMLVKALGKPDSKSAERLLNHGYGMPKQIVEQQVVFDKPQLQTAIDGEIISLKILSDTPLPPDELPSE